MQDPPRRGAPWRTGPRRRRRQEAPCEVLPPLTPPDPDRRTGLLERLGVHLTAACAERDRFRRQGRDEDGDPVARLTVYVLNATVMVLAFPVGFGLMLFNILGGENLRTTAHVMALTGLGIALRETEAGARLLGFG